MGTSISVWNVVISRQVFQTTMAHSPNYLRHPNGIFDQPPLSSATVIVLDKTVDCKQRITFGFDSNNIGLKNEKPNQWCKRCVCFRWYDKEEVERERILLGLRRSKNSFSQFVQDSNARSVANLYYNVFFLSQFLTEPDFQFVNGSNHSCCCRPDSQIMVG